MSFPTPSPRPSATLLRPVPTRPRGLGRFGALLGAWLVAGTLGTGLGVAGAEEAARAPESETPRIQVYKTPTCGCCGKWIAHLREAGFRVEATDLPDLSTLKATNGVPPKLASCHTALVGGYVIEGHVPAEDVKRLLAERPAVAGLAVPGMPLGSPGMEHPDPRRHEAYDVLSFGPDGIARFASHRP